MVSPLAGIDLLTGKTIPRISDIHKSPMEIIEPITHVEICRDSDDNKFPEMQKTFMDSAAVRI